MHDFPERNPACSVMIFPVNVCGEPVQDQSLELLLGETQQRDDSGALCLGFFPCFSSATTFACCQSLGTLLLMMQLFKKHSNQSLAFGPNCLMSSIWMSYRPVALAFFSVLIPASTWVCLVNTRSLGYQCRSRCNLVYLLFLFASFCIVVEALLLCVISVDSIRVCHDLQRSSELIVSKGI